MKLNIVHIQLNLKLNPSLALSVNTVIADGHDNSRGEC